MREISEESRDCSPEIQYLDANTSDTPSPKKKALSDMQKELDCDIKQASNDLNSLKDSDDGEWFPYYGQIDSLVEESFGQMASFFANKQEESVPMENPTDEHNYNSYDFGTLMSSSDDSTSKGSYEEDLASRFPDENNERFSFFSQKYKTSEEKQSLEQLKEDLSLLQNLPSSSMVMKVTRLNFDKTCLSVWLECGQETLRCFEKFLQTDQTYVDYYFQIAKRMKEQLIKQISELEKIKLFHALRIVLNTDSIFITRQGLFKFSLRPCTEASKNNQKTEEKKEIIPLNRWHATNVESINKFVDDFFLSMTPIGFSCMKKPLKNSAFTEKDMQKLKGKFNIYLLDQKYSQLKGAQRLSKFSKLQQLCTGLELKDWLQEKLQVYQNFEENRQLIYHWIKKILTLIGEKELADKWKLSPNTACSSPLSTKTKLLSENEMEESKESLVRMRSAPTGGDSQMGVSSMDKVVEDKNDFFFVVDEDSEFNFNRKSDWNSERKYSF